MSYTGVMKRVAAAIGIIIILAVLILLFSHNASAPGPGGSSSTSKPAPETPGFNKQLHSLDTPGSLWWIVSKVRPINPVDYAPADLTTPKVPIRANVNSSEVRLRKEPSIALEQMITDAKNAGINLLLVSAYRSYQLQVSVYNGYVQQYGQTGADKISARPGTSEHQTGLAADLGSASRQCELEECFADMPEGKWLAENAHLYGFIIRYPQGKDAITGYQFEPWHLRYIGKELSQEMYKENIKTPEEFFNIIPPSQPY